MSTNKPTPPAKLAKFKVTPIAPVAADISPPEDWNIRHPQGFYMAADDTPAGRLVLLADVLRWLEKSRSLPRKVALSAFCEAMPPEIMQWLYRVVADDYAKPLPVDFMSVERYYDFTEKELQVRNQRTRQEEAYSYLAELIKKINESKFFEDSVLTPLSISINNCLLYTSPSPRD